jgi:hypothetical protein
LRRQRAQQIDPAGIEPLDLGWCVVPSSPDPTGYAVHIDFDPDGKLTVASCTCPDCERITPAAPPTLHGLRVCRHM